MAITKQYEGLNSNLEKQIKMLKEPAKRAKSAIINILEKSNKRFKEESDKLESGEQKQNLLKRLEKISKDLEFLKNLSEEEVITFAIETQQNLMAIASNPRLPKTDRIKARVASNKRLSTHLHRIKKKIETEEEEEVKNTKKLDKISVNKQIVLMRKGVKRAKIHVIHKLTRKIQMLRRSKCTGDKKEKLEKKAERFVKKIKYMKGFEPDEISRFALTSTQDLNKVANDIKWPLKTQAMATIAIHKFVAEPVANFKSSFPDAHKTVPAILKKKKKKRKLNIETKEIVKVPKILPDKAESECEDSELEESDIEEDKESENEESNVEEDKESDHLKEESDGESRIEPVANFKSSFPDVDKKVPAILKKNKKKRKLNIKTKEIVKIPKKLPDKAESEYEYSENEESDVEEDKESDHLKEESDRESRIDEEEQSVLDEESDHEQSEDIQEGSIMDEDVPSGSESDSASQEKHVAGNIIGKKIKINTSVNIKNSKVTPIQIENKLVKTKVPKGNNSSKTKNNKSRSSSKKSISKVSENKPTVVDPFFVTATNKEYITTQVPKTGENDSKWEDSSLTGPNRFNRKSKWNDRDDRWGKNKFENRVIAPSKKPFSDIFGKFSKAPIISKSTNGVVPNIFANRKERRKSLQQPLIREEKKEKLHPSWEAKKKQTTIANFQGKKILFD